MENISEAQMKIMNDLEAEMLEDMYKRLTNSCQAKCIPPSYKDSELNKGEAVCLDRCVAKYLEVQNVISKSVQEQSAPMPMQGQT